MVVALLHSPKYKDSALSLAEVLRDMVDAKSLFRAALWRRSCLIAACLYLCDTALVATLFGGLPLLLRLQFIDLFKMLLRTALWMIPAHVALMFVVAAFFLETVCIDNPVYATQKLLYTILSPVTVGFILGHSLHQVASDMSSPYPVRGALPLSLLSGALAVAAFTSRRRAELRHQYVVEAAPAVFRKLWMRFCRLVPVALFDTLATVAYVFAAGLVSGALAALVETVLKTIKSAAVVVDSINADNIAAVRQVVPPFKLFMGLLLGLISCGLDLIRYGLVLIRFVCNVGSIRDTYHCILIFLVIYIALSLAEEIWRAILFHPMKFSRLRSFVASSGAPAECAVLAEAVTAILPPKISSAQGLMSKSADLPPIDHNNEQSRCKVKINSEAVSQNSQRQQLWLQTLIAQLDIADAILTAVKPSPSGHCPLVPALTCPSSACKGVSPDGSLSSALNDAVLVLMEALAAQDLSRSARGLHSLEVIGSTCQLYSATISQRQDELLESELDALPLAGKDWSKVAFSSCAIIDAAALQV